MGGLKESSRWLRRNVIIPATFGYRCAQAAWWSTIPPRIQSLTLLAFALMNGFFTFCGYKIIPENL